MFYNIFGWHECSVTKNYKVEVCLFWLLVKWVIIINIKDIFMFSINDNSCETKSVTNNMTVDVSILKYQVTVDEGKLTYKMSN